MLPDKGILSIIKHVCEGRRGMEEVKCPPSASEIMPSAPPEQNAALADREGLKEAQAMFRV